MIFGKNTTHNISKLSQIEITYNNFEIALLVFMPNITTNHTITYTNKNLPWVQEVITQKNDPLV